MTNFKDEKNEYLSVSFNKLNLSSKKIYSQEFDSCTFEGCNFSETMFSNCSFIDCCFVRCNLSIARVEDSKFSEVAFNECKAIGVDWSKASWPKIALFSPIKFHNCIINDSSFFGLSLEQIILEKCKAHNVDFREGNFSEGNFTYTDLSNSMFNKTNLIGANFTNAINYNIDIYLNEIKKAKFSRYEAVRLLYSIGIELVD